MERMMDSQVVKKMMQSAILMAIAMVGTLIVLAWLATGG